MLFSLNTYTSHISLYDLLFLGIIFTGLNFSLLLWLSKSINRAANRFLSLALVVVVLWMVRIEGWLPLQFSQALGPLIYFYVLKITLPERKFTSKDLLHFIPLLLQLCASVLAMKESAPTVTILLPLLPFTSIIAYLYLSIRQIESFYRGLEFNEENDRYRREFRWLHRLLIGFGLLWLLAVPYIAIVYFSGHHPLGEDVYYPLYILLGVTVTWIGAVAFMKSAGGVPAEAYPALSSSVSTELRHKATWLKKAMEARLYYRDPELSLSSLAEKLEIHPHELSRIINVALKKNFSDFVNEYRVKEFIRKMRDPAYDRITLLGMAYDSGFNSQSTFTRIFKQMTGRTPAEYKNELKKDCPSYKLGSSRQLPPVILHRESLPKWSHDKLNWNFMFKNYLKTAWRGLFRNKSQSFINIAGLAVGLCCSLLILLWVQNEYSVDSFYKNSGRLFKVYKTDFYNHAVSGGTYEMPGILADELKKTVPDIQYATNMGFGELSAFQTGNKVVKMNGNSAGADFFKMFSYPLLQGSAQTALNSPDAIAISRKMAEIFYGSPEQAIGKAIHYQNRKYLKISAVFENLPVNDSQSFDFLTNWDLFLENNPWAKDMGNSGPTAYVMLGPHAHVKAVDVKIAHFFEGYFHVDRKTELSFSNLALQSYAEVYLHSNLQSGKPDGGRIEYVRLFSIIAIFILLMACINFMNLMTARSVKRAKEVGIRKAVGALRFPLIGQFFCEAFVVTAIAAVIAVALLALALPWFNQLIQKQLSLPFGQPAFWIKILGITLITCLLSGSYPALFLSAFKPVKVLKSTVRLNTGTLLFRKGLVIFQFVLAALLITGTIIVTRQMHYMESKDLGYNRENVVCVPVEGTLDSQYGVFKNELLTQPGIQSVSRINMPPADIYGSSAAVNWTGHDSTMNTFFTHAVIGYDYFKTMKLTLLAGREFSAAYPSDTSGYILNEAALKLTGYKNPIGKPFTWLHKRAAIVGIVKDFHFHSLHEPVGPMILALGENQHGGVVIIRTQPGKTQTALARIQQTSKQINPAFPPVIYFVDQEYQQLYQNDQVINRLSDIFAILAIFISCLGLLGLAMFTAEQRVKEIGIRKVLGATVSGLFGLLSAEFITLIAIAIVIALPVAWYATAGWLNSFAYRAPLQWWVFTLSGGLIITIALLTVSFQVVKAALTNPVKSLRSE